jgi:hypothetical protein
LKQTGLHEGSDRCLRLHAVRRLLFIVLLALLPLQFSWAAVGAYCGHAGEAPAGHPGSFCQHEHPQHGDNVAVPDGDEAPAGAELDCGHCHGHCSVMPMSCAGLPPAVSVVVPGALLEKAGAPHAPSRPERPQWPPLA